MSDLSSKKASQSVKLTGANNASGDETNFASVDANGNLLVNQRTSSGSEISYNHGVSDSSTQRVAAQLGVNGAAATTTNRVPTTDLLNLGFITAEKTSTSAASVARVGVANQVGRKVIEIINTSTVVIYVGSSTVAVNGANRGRPINPKASYSIALADNVDLYVISASNATYVVVEGG